MPADRAHLHEQYRLLACWFSPPCPCLARPCHVLQLEDIKSKRGLSVMDGTIAADKPLAEVRWVGKRQGRAGAVPAGWQAGRQQWSAMLSWSGKPWPGCTRQALWRAFGVEAAPRHRFHRVQGCCQAGVGRVDVH